MRAISLARPPEPDPGSSSSPTITLHTMSDPTADWLTPEFFQNPYPYYTALRA